MSSARTAVVNTADPTLHAALWLAFVCAAIKLTLHIAANLWESHIGYGYFRDEMYYLICGRHLAWDMLTTVHSSRFRHVLPKCF